MPGNSFGDLFKVTTFGESHGGWMGAIVDGCLPGLELSEEDIQPQLDRRKPGQSKITTQRKETDTIQILSGVFEGKTSGTPIALVAKNKDPRPQDYEHLKDLLRPGHADFTYNEKYGNRDWRRSGRASARETLARVAAGAVAEKFLKEKLGIEFLSWTESVGSIKADVNMDAVTIDDIESNIVRCPDQKKADEMISLIEKVNSEGDSIGGVVRGVIRNLPVGLGEPVFDRVSADLAKAMMSINATKGFEFGSGFEGTKMRGSEHNDEFYRDDDGKIKTKSNNAGGTLGGITTGMPITFRVAFKPVATIEKEQNTVDKNGKAIKLEAAGRHDPCVVPRAIPIVDAMAALVIMDHWLKRRAVFME
jgi:chorismate synthase